MDSPLPHPYLRLAHNRPFVAFWLAQAISLLGDRVHTVAAAVLVLGLSGSPALTVLVFLSGFLPNIVLGPLAGVFVDRWDDKRTMIASDLLRAGLVLAIPLAAGVNPVLVLPISFLITSAGLFFRPAKIAIVPRLVGPDDLMAANSAAWVADSLADLGGYPLAALLVAILGPALTIAFVVDSASYILSAVLIASLPGGRRAVATLERSFRRELVAGFRFLHADAALWENTLLSAVAQIAVAASVSLTIIYAAQTLRGLVAYPASYPILEFAMGLGALAGSVLIGTLAARVRRGRLILAGYGINAAGLIGLGLTDQTGLAIGLMVLIGVSNLVWLVPTQTVFQERVPRVLMGRVVAARSSIVAGATAAAIGLASVLVASIPASELILAAGLVTGGAALAGLGRRAIRSPETVATIE